MGYGGKPAHIASEVSAHFATGICRLKPAHIASEVSAHFAKGGSRRILQTANPNPAHFANIPILFTSKSSKANCNIKDL